MARLIKKDRGNYTNISNVLVRDKRLSWKARGIFIYLWSQANEWQFYVSEIATHATDGVKALRSGLDELESYGYLKRVNRHSESGSFDGMDWILSDVSNLKTSQGDSTDNRCDHLGDDAEMEQNSQNKCQNTSDAKGVGRDKGLTQNGTVRNNNNKNYQQQEVTKISKEDIDSSTNVEQRIFNPDIWEDFKKIWELYPNKKGKKQAFNHYKKWRKESVNHTNDYLEKKLDTYLTYCNQNRNWYHPMNGSTWFNGRFDDDYKVEIKAVEPISGGYEELLNGKNIQDIPDDKLPF